MKTWIKIIDIVIIMAVTAVTFFAAYIVYMKPQEKAQILIRGQNDEWIFPINSIETIAVKGPVGETVVRIHGSKAWIEESPCENQTCVAAGEIHKQGQWASCLPNNVLLMIQGTKNESGENDIDSVAW